MPRDDLLSVSSGPAACINRSGAGGCPARPAPGRAGGTTQRRGPARAWPAAAPRVPGGSITYHGGHDGYVHQVGQWFRRNYLESAITVVNAGLSGTDSTFGSKRLDRDVLKHDPDILFIEFAVNDGDRDHTEHMERIIHKAWRHNPQMDLVIFYTLARNMLPHYAKGVLPPSAQAHERVAEHYGIPTIGLAHDVAARLRSGDLAWDAFSKDSCHPHPGGYRLYVASFEKALPALLDEAASRAHPLPAPLTPGLVVYPPAIKATPLETPVYVDPQHGPARRSFSLPEAGVHWVSEPEYAGADGKTLWRLHYLSHRGEHGLGPGLARQKADWSGHVAQWFEEDRSFVGSGSFPLFARKPPELRWSDRESAVLVFVAPEGGLYRFSVKTDGYLKTWRRDETRAALNILHFAWGEAEGTCVKHVTTPMREKGSDPLTMAGEQRMAAGEELVFAVNSDAPHHARNGFAGVQIGIGLYPTPPRSP